MIQLHRSRRVEALVEALAAELARHSPSDPLVPVPIVVGGRGIERWLKQAVATRLGTASNLAFLFPGSAFRGATQHLLAPPGSVEFPPRHRKADVDPWAAAALRPHVLRAIRKLHDQPAFDKVRAYLGPATQAIGAREFAFANEVSACLERLLWDRPGDVLAWTETPDAAPAEHRWLALLLRELEGVIPEPSGARRLFELERRPASRHRAPLHVFGLSTLRPGDKRRLAALARHYDVQLYVLAASSEWIGHLSSRRELQSRLRKAATNADLERLFEELGTTNALLSANATPSRDVQGWLEDVGYEEVPEADAPTPSQGLLGAVQDWIDRSEPGPAGAIAEWAAAASEERARDDATASIELHRSHGPIRQCEVLRDLLVKRFAADPTLEPRHVLVMTPDVATFAPLLSAVLSRAPAIPVQLHDLGLRATNPVGETLLTLLRWTSERVTAPDLLQLLELRPVHLRFGLDAADLPPLRELVRASNLRWAWDAADRARHDQPELDANTVRFGLERLAFGVLMAADEPALEPTACPVAPVPDIDREGARRFGAFAAFCERVRDEVDGLASPRSAREWRRSLTHALDALVSLPGAEIWLRTQVQRCLDELQTDPDDPFPIEAAAIRTALEAALGLPQRESAPASGAVQVAGLEPMRSVPCRVIALVGMDDQAFPRSNIASTWDPFAVPRAGEHDRATIDRHLYLEALLCARDAFLVIGRGVEGERNKPVPMSAVAEELAETLSRGLGFTPMDEESGQGLAAPFLQRHPLQPWNLGAFAGASSPGTDARWFRAGLGLRDAERRAPRPQGLAASRPGVEWPPDAERPSWTVDELAHALSKPQQELLRLRLGLSLRIADRTLEDREPIEETNLDDWALRERILSALAAPDSKAGDAAATLRSKLAAEGLLALRAGGERQFEDRWTEARQVIEAANAVGPLFADLPRHVSCQLGTTMVTARIDELRRSPDGPVIIVRSPSKSPNETVLLRSLLTLLVARVQGGELGAASARCIGFHEAPVLRLPAELDATAVLTALVRSARAAREGPSWLFPRLSMELVRTLRPRKPPKLRKADAAPPKPPPSRREALEKCAPIWEGRPNEQRGVADDAWIAPLFGHLSFEELLDRADLITETALPVWGPVFDAIDAGAGGES